MAARLGAADDLGDEPQVGIVVGADIMPKERRTGFLC